MARKRKASAKGSTGEPFVRVPQSWIGYLRDAHVTSIELYVFLALVQHPQRNGLYSRPVSDYGADRDGVDRTGISTVTHVRANQVTRALANLCNKRTITLPDGTTTTVLAPVVRGHRGRVAVYRCNLPREGNSATKKGAKATEESTTQQQSKEPEKHYTDESTVNPSEQHHLEKKGSGRAKPDPPTPLLR